MNHVAAGPFLEWLDQFRASLRGNGGTNVPCGDCIGCCVSSYSILVRPEDQRARAAIPSDLLVSAPGLPKGHKVMGYYSDGTCPMLSDRKCTIYDSRPQTCRDYDCRVFAGAGMLAGSEKPVINKRVGEWRFTYRADADRRAHAAMQAAAAFIQNNATSFPDGRAPKNPSGIAVLAAKVYTVFLDETLSSENTAIALAIVATSKAFDAGE